MNLTTLTYAEFEHAQLMQHMATLYTECILSVVERHDRYKQET